MSASHAKRRNTLSERQYVLGRKDTTSDGVLNIGRYYTLDGSFGASVYLDALRPHMVFICGKRGYGKSYTIGVFLEELALLEDDVKQNLAILVVDTLGIFWTTQFSTNDKKEDLLRWGRKPQGFPLRLFVPDTAMDEYKKNKISVECLSLRIAELSPLHWYQLFDVKATDPVGIILTRAIMMLRQSSDCFSFEDIMNAVQANEYADNITKGAVINFFFMAKSWGVFDKKGLVISDLVKRGTITILDISQLQNPVLKDIVVSLISEKIFEERVKERKVHEQKKIGLLVQETGIPQVWLAVDEAQLFVPGDKNTLSKKVLIEEWMRQGRQPGLSLIMATQRPSAVDSEVLSHSDILICHRLTAQEDIDALSRVRPTYMHGDISESIKKIGSEKGVALVVDDTSEAVQLIKIRPRLSWHGGAEPVINEVK